MGEFICDGCAEIEIAQQVKAEAAQENEQAWGEQIPGKAGSVLFSQAQEGDIAVDTHRRRDDGVYAP